MDTVGLISGIVSIILGFFSLFLAIYFFIETKKTEHTVQVALAEIKTQTGMLERFNVKYLDKLTKYVTTDRPERADAVYAAYLELSTVVRELPNSVAQLITTSSEGQRSEALTDNAISSHIATTYYAALLNFFTQFELPSEAEFSPTDAYHTLLQRVVNGSAADVRIMSDFLAGLPEERIRKNRLVVLYDETMTLWHSDVRTVEQLYEHRARGSEAA